MSFRLMFFHGFFVLFCSVYLMLQCLFHYVPFLSLVCTFVSDGIRSTFIWQCIQTAKQARTMKHTKKHKQSNKDVTSRIKIQNTSKGGICCLDSDFSVVEESCESPSCSKCVFLHCSNFLKISRAPALTQKHLFFFCPPPFSVFSFLQDLVLNYHLSCYSKHGSRGKNNIPL